MTSSTGLRKLEPSSVSFEDAVEILETRGKLVGSKKKGARGKKEKKQKSTTASKKGAKSGYQVFVAELMKQGSKMGEAASAWKKLDVAQQQEFKEKASQLNEAIASDETVSSPKSSRATKEVSTTATKTKTGT